MKKLLIIAIAILPFLCSCDKGKPCVKIYSAYLYTWGMVKKWNFKKYKEQPGLGETQIGGKDAGTIGGWSFLMRYYEKGELVF